MNLLFTVSHSLLYVSMINFKYPSLKYLYPWLCILGSLYPFNYLYSWFPKYILSTICTLGSLYISFQLSVSLVPYIYPFNYLYPWFPEYILSTICILASLNISFQLSVSLVPCILSTICILGFL